MKKFPRNQTLFNKLNQSLRSITSWKLQNSNLRAENEVLKKTNRKLNGKSATEPPKEWEDTLEDLHKTIKLKEKEIEELKKENTKLRSFKDIGERIAKRKESTQSKETKRQRIGEGGKKDVEGGKSNKKPCAAKTATGVKSSLMTCNVLRVRESNQVNMNVARKVNTPSTKSGGEVDKLNKVGVGVSKNKKTSIPTKIQEQARPQTSGPSTSAKP